MISRKRGSGARAISRSTAGVTSSWVRMIILFSFGGVLPSRTLAPVEFPPNRRKVLPLPPRLREGRGGDFGTPVPVVAHPEFRAALPKMAGREIRRKSLVHCCKSTPLPFRTGQCARGHGAAQR